MSVSIVRFIIVVRSPLSYGFSLLGDGALRKGFLEAGASLRLPLEKTSNVLPLEHSIATTRGLNCLSKICKRRRYKIEIDSLA